MRDTSTKRAEFRESLVPCLWTVKPISYKLEARCYSPSQFLVCKKAPGNFVKMTPWIINTDFVPNMLLFKPPRWALIEQWFAIILENAVYQYDLGTFYLGTFMNSFLINMIKFILLYHFNKAVHLFIRESYVIESFTFLLSDYRCGKNVVVCLASHT